MKRRDFITSSTLGAIGVGAGSNLPWEDALPAELFPEPAPAPVRPRSKLATRKILIAGGGFREAFVRYMAQLTGKPRPRLCYLPTASPPSGRSSQRCGRKVPAPRLKMSGWGS